MARGHDIAFHGYRCALQNCTDTRGNSCTREEIPRGGEIYISESTDSSLLLETVGLDDPP